MRSTPCASLTRPSSTRLSAKPHETQSTHIGRMLASKRQMIASSQARAGTAHTTRAVMPPRAHSAPARANARQQRSNGSVVVVVAAARVAPVAVRRRGAFTSSPARQLRASVRVRSSSARSRSSAVVVQANLFARLSRLIKVRPQAPGKARSRTFAFAFDRAALLVRTMCAGGRGRLPGQL